MQSSSAPRSFGSAEKKIEAKGRDMGEETERRKKESWGRRPRSGGDHTHGEVYRPPETETPSPRVRGSLRSN
jgi:hypothetical protein